MLGADETPTEEPPHLDGPAVTQKQELARFNREYSKIRPTIVARSGGMCESVRFVHARFGFPRTVLPEESELAEALAAFLDLVQTGGHDLMRPTEVHHRKYRGRSRGGTNSPDNLIHICKACHDWIHAHGGFGGLANILGLALSAGQSEELESHAPPTR